MALTIRRYADTDAEVVLAIEQTCQPNPWPRARFEIFSTLVAEVDGRVVGFACHSVNHAPGADETLLLANLAVHPDFRRRGIGRALLEARLRVGAAAGLRTALTITRATNEPLKTLYRQYGFQEGRRLPGYYEPTAEDGLVLHRALDPEAEPPWRDVAPSPDRASATEILREAGAAFERDEHERVLELVEPLLTNPAYAPVARAYRLPVLAALGRHAEADLEAERLPREPGGALFHALLGERYLEAGLSEAAVREFLATLAAGGDDADPRVWVGLGVAWERLGRHEEACWAHERLLRDDPRNLWVLVRAAWAHLRCGRPARGLTILDVAVDVDETRAEVHAARGLALWLLGRRDDAKLALQRALALDPEKRHVSIQLAALETGAESPRW